MVAVQPQSDQILSIRRFTMPPLEPRPWRLVLLLGSVLLVTAYLPHPSLGESLPQTLDNLMRSEALAETRGPS